MNNQSIDKTSLADWTRSKPDYDSFMYTPDNSAALCGDDELLPNGTHNVTHVTFDFATEVYTFHNDKTVVATCTEADELDLEISLWTA